VLNHALPHQHNSARNQGRRPRTCRYGPQAALGVRVEYWRRLNPFDTDKLLGVAVEWDPTTLRMTQVAGVVAEQKGAMVHFEGPGPASSRRVHHSRPSGY
jgi:hypothetical protein